MIDNVGHGMVTVMFKGNLTVKLLDVADVTDLWFTMFSLMAEHRRGVGFKTQHSGMRISPFDVRLRFEGYDSMYSSFSCRIEPDDDGCVPPLNVPPNVTPIP